MAKRGAPVGNTNGAKGRMWLDALSRRIAQRPKDLEDIANAVIEAAKAGEPWAITELGNRLDGKPMQPVEHSGEFTQRLAHEYSNAELAMIAAGKEPSASAETDKRVN